MKIGSKIVKLEGELTVSPAKICETCKDVLTFDDNGVLVCKVCRPQ